ncbi:MAG: DegT/DnrJ/EryC1/StrS family aminotransferase [bacterium]|nr:DegT/DnrJ/EryC1/StrS family aminotransferase [bacterium]
MEKRNIPLYDLKLSPGTRKRVNAVLSSGWLSTGPLARELEKQVAKRAHVRYAAAVSSATAGLQMTLEAIGARKGSEVITSPFTFCATAEAILRSEAIPVFADIDPATLNIDPDEVERKITSNTLCVMPVDIAGHPANYKSLGAICRKRRLPVIADASHALGATWRGKTVAQLADAAIHSFQATKNVTSAEGGIVASRHKQLVERVQLLSRHAMTANAFQRKKANKWEYDVVGLGFKGNLSDLHAAVGLGELTVFDKNQAKRARIAARYMKGLSGLEDHLELPPENNAYHHAWHLFIIRLHLSHLKISRDRFIKLMAGEGVQCGVHYKPLFEMSYYRQLGFLPQYFPNAAYAGQRVISLPMYPQLSMSDVDYVCAAVRRLVEKHVR